MNILATLILLMAPGLQEEPFQVTKTNCVEPCKSLSIQSTDLRKKEQKQFTIVAEATAFDIKGTGMWTALVYKLTDGTSVLLYRGDDLRQYFISNPKSVESGLQVDTTPVPDRRVGYVIIENDTVSFKEYDKVAFCFYDWDSLAEALKANQVKRAEQIRARIWFKNIVQHPYTFTVDPTRSTTPVFYQRRV